MGRGDGVEVRDSSIRLFFVDQDGARRRETLTVNGKPMPPTPANIKFAQRTAAEIRQKIALGMFTLADYFPDSKRAKKAPPHTFGPLADSWLKSKGDLAAATLDQYTNAVAIWKALLGRETALDHLTHQVLAAKIGEYPWASAKTLNNYLIPLRGIFAFEYRGRRTIDNPMIGIANRKVVKKIPDPLTADERDRILADLRERYDPRIAAYYAFAFFTGMRPEEIIALRWADIDTASATARVQRVRTFRGSERDGSKTHAERDVDLVTPAVEALDAMRPYTFMKRTKEGEPVEVFENPVTGRPWHDERSQRDHYWHPCLRRLGIRRRRPYATRHTYCTVALMREVNPAYIAAQAGHSIKILLDTYARWVPGADGGRQRRMLEAASSPAVPQPTDAEKRKAPEPNTSAGSEAVQFGRRDWTRRNAGGGRRGT